MTWADRGVYSLGIPLEGIGMIKRQATSNGKVKVTFSLPLDMAPSATSVTGDFNDWNPLATPMKKRSNGTRSASIELEAGSATCFKYLADGGSWFNDPDVEVDGEGNNWLVA